MRLVLAHLLCIWWGFCSGLVVSTGIVSFITAIGIIPRLTMKARISKHFYAIGTTAVVAAFLGMLCSIEGVRIPMPKVLIGVLAFCFGVFIGCLAVAIAEVINVLPVMTRRMQLRNGVFWFMIAFAIGKLVGALYFWQYPNFFTIN